MCPEGSEHLMGSEDIGPQNRIAVQSYNLLWVLTQSDPMGVKGQSGHHLHLQIPQAGGSLQWLAQL